MSAWIVEKETIDRVVEGIASDTWNGQIFMGIDTQTDEGKSQIGKLLWNANHRAVNQRYGENNRAGPYRFTYRVKNNSPVQLCKAVCCLRYQMSEGNVPDSKIYKELSKQIEIQQSAIVSALPEYAAADWG